MPRDDALIALAAVLSAWMAIAIGYSLVRYIVRREVKRALTSLRNAKFTLTVRDPKTGRYAKGL